MTQFSGYIGTIPVPRGTRTITHGVTNTLSDYILVPNGYTVGAIIVYIDGKRLDESQYVATDGLSVLFHNNLPPGTRYLFEEISQYEIPKHNLVTLENNTYKSIIYTTDLLNKDLINIEQLPLHMLIYSSFFDSTKTYGSGSVWQVDSFISHAPDNEPGLNSDGRIYLISTTGYTRLRMVADQCSPLHFGKGAPVVRELTNVCGGFNNQTMILVGFWEPGDGQGGLYFWNEHENKSNHNGLSIIDPNMVEKLGTGPDIPVEYYHSNNSGTGCWIRITN